MTTLKIRLDVKDLHDGPREFGVVANVVPIPSREQPGTLTEEQRKRLQNLLIPAGGWEPDPEFHTIRLPPGRYFVEAVLPSEEVVGEEVVLTDSPAPVELRLTASESPHEWMSWQRFAGNVVSTDAYDQRLKVTMEGVPIAPEAVVVSTGSTPRQSPLEFGVADEIAWLPQGYFFANDGLLASLRAGQLAAYPGWAQLNPPARLSAVLQGYALDLAYDTFAFEQNIVDRFLGSPAFRDDYRQERYDRYFLFVHGQGYPDQYCVLPLPWKLTDFSGQQAPIDVLVWRSGADESSMNGLEQGFRISVVVRDKIFGSLIGYLGAGRMPAAETIVGYATDMLFEKVSNPFAAAAGAYVLLNNLGSERPVYWHEWIKNLMNWFPWLPDGAILYGRVLLGRSRDPDKLSEARSCFLEGFRRGVPVYSKGVGYLLDGLNRFANDARRRSERDPQVEQALKIVRDMAFRTNVRQPFTCIQTG